MKDETGNKLKGLMDKAVAEKELAGGCLLVRCHGEECCYLEAGMADVEEGKPIERDQIYRLYSMSKPVTGAAAMKLFEEGALDLGQPVSAYLPSFQDSLVEQDGRLVKADRQIQVQDLLNMTSGLVYNGEAGLAGRHADEVFGELMDRLQTDHPMTTRELARMIKKLGIRFRDLPDEEFDVPLGIGTGAAVIFGATGGVMEAALRTAVETLTGEELPNVDFTQVRGTEGIKEAAYQVAGMEVKVAVASGLANARKLLNMVKNGEAQYHFIEIMGCPGGCVNGGGQPQQPGHVRNTTDIRALRASVLYQLDEKNAIRKSHENPAIKELYDTFLGKPGSSKAHHLLHTSYVKRSIN